MESFSMFLINIWKESVANLFLKTEDEKKQMVPFFNVFGMTRVGDW